ncbi:phosphoribosyltransferase family protein [Trinickia caryophylli]|nr:phosphoribosyltransferase family protein [Trinickia caryophylli]PMS08824.1 phosphoribosyl transferase [Trinickia caryophylli]TRX20174.1 phosphoribosyltransferase [Trinickia caryophylli]WQE13808.1 phosphoribosyltransferase family protein [Trinickia caryophylli]
MESFFKDRSEAGRMLADRLRQQGYGGGGNTVVLALARGGVPVACEVARALGAPIDVLPVRKLGVPSQPELAMGAIGPDGAQFVDDEIVRSAQVSPEEFAAVLAAERAELARREVLYRGNRGPVPIEGKTAIVVDDGIATGATMQAAARALRARHPARLIIAVPVSPPGAAKDFADVVDAFVVIAQPALFFSVGQFYEDFRQTTDDEVRALLERAHGSGDGDEAGA